MAQDIVQNVTRNFRESVLVAEIPFSRLLILVPMPRRKQCVHLITDRKALV